MYSLYDTVLLKCMSMNADILCVCSWGAGIHINLISSRLCVVYIYKLLSPHSTVYMYIMYNM